MILPCHLILPGLVESWEEKYDTDVNNPLPEDIGYTDQMLGHLKFM